MDKPISRDLLKNSGVFFWQKCRRTILAIGSWTECAGIATRCAKTAILIILAHQG